jgi:hypothetical protein
MQHLTWSPLTPLEISSTRASNQQTRRGQLFHLMVAQISLLEFVNSARQMPNRGLTEFGQIYYAMESANSLPLSPYCQPIMSYLKLWGNITGFNAYMRSVLGMGLSSCNGTSLAQYTSTPSLLTRGLVESVVSLIATEFIWLAGALGSVGGGLDRQTEESLVTEYMLQWRLNINAWPVIAALCASIVLHVVLLALLVRHPEHSVVLPFESSTMTTSLSALLQVMYTLYSALLVTTTQRLALFRIVGRRRKLTTVHDVSGAWTGIGAAILTLWRQRLVPSSILEVTAVVTYLISMLVLHISASSIMQWQAFSSTLVGVLPSDLALPGSAVNISQLGWVEIFPIARSIGQDADVSMYGLSNSTIYDVPQDPISVAFSEASVNATTLNVQCGLVPNLTLSYQSSEEEYQISFSLKGTDNGSFLESPIWKDVVYSITPNTQCAACPQTLFYMITTGIDVDESVSDAVAVNLSWTYTPSGGSPQISTTVTYISACSVSARTVPATLNLQEDQLTSITDQTASSSSTSWSVWSPGNATDLSIGMTSALANDMAAALLVFQQGNLSAYFTEMDK